MDVTENYREQLRLEYERRACLNVHYSMRAFARDLGMAPSSICEVLSGKHGLSKSKAAGVALRLGFNSLETKDFLDKVECAHSKDLVKREKALQRVKSRQIRKSQQVNLDTFKIIKDCSQSL